MDSVSKGARVLACASVCLLACGRDPLVAETACGEIEPGDVVVTEIHANPDGSDGDGEYIELFNASDGELALDGLTLATSRADGTSSKSHRLSEVWLDAGDYLIVGNAVPGSSPAHVDYSYGNTLGNLRNSDAIISVSCGGLLVDEVRYARTTDGYALQLDGQLEPDHMLNDDPRYWCTARGAAEQVSPGNFGTPGSANGACEAAQVEGGCLEDGAEREVVAPASGKLRITEWMANPAGADTGLEWVEVAFDAEADLNALQLGVAPDALKAVIERADCVRVGAGDRIVFGASPGAAPRVDADLRFSLANSGERSIVAGADGIVLDRVDYESTESGSAWQVDENGTACLTPVDEEYASGNFGTPGEANPICPLEPGPGMCLEGGIPRDVISPRAGAARITEWMANPSTVDNRDGEWVEVRFDQAVDLNGITLSDLTTNTTTIEDEKCLAVDRGAYVVLARSLDRAANGGIDAVDAELTLSLNNSDEVITLSVDDLVLDSVAYGDSTPGVATQVDVLGNACNAMSPYGDGDLGTPGTANPGCP